MTSRLSSLLVRDGVIGVKRMEKAFQRQVLFGGALDTILLEMNELPEQRLLQYLSLATGLPPATSRELAHLDSVAVETCPRDMAERYQVVPLSFDGDALRVLARDPVDLGALEDLASDLEVPVQPFVAPEFRFELAFDRAFGRKSDQRFVRLAEVAKKAAPPIPAVGKPRTVVVEAGLAGGGGGAAAAGGSSSARRTQDLTTESLRKRRLETEREAEEVRSRRQRQATGDGQGAADDDFDDDLTPPEISIEYGAGTGASAHDDAEAEAAAALAGDVNLSDGVVEPVAAHDTQRVPFLSHEQRESELVSGEIADPGATAPRPVRTSAVLIAPPSRLMPAFDPSPLTVGEARSLLEQAEHRDLVFQVLLRALRGRTWYAAVLTVQGGAAIGRLAIAGDEIDQSNVTQVLIPLDVASPFRQAVHTASPYIGPVATGDSEVDEMIKRMGGVMPPSAMLAPVSLKNRVVALLVGHRGADSLRVTEVSELLPLTNAAGEALGRIIMRVKARGSQPMPADKGGPAGAAQGKSSGVPGQDADDAPTGPVKQPGGKKNRSGRTRRGASAKPEPAPPAPAPAAPPRAGGMPSTDLETLMAAVQSDEPREVEVAINEALTRAAEILPWLHEHFPGTLKVDRIELGGRHLRAAQHGAVLDLVVRIGDAAAGLLIERLREGPRDVRYYAALCLSEMRSPGAEGALVERLFDSDYGVREVATEALSGYPIELLDEALELPRRELHSEDVERIETAAKALAALADVRAIPDLLDVHGRGGDAAHVVAKALVRLAKQDFGVNNRKWRQWWDKNRRKNRVEWLLDGLGHKSAEIRRSSAEDLRKATGEYFGYHHDLPRREREQARQRWLSWWTQTGRLHFLPQPEHERHRPTALLPPRRPDQM